MTGWARLAPLGALAGLLACDVSKPPPVPDGYSAGGGGGGTTDSAEDCDVCALFDCAEPSTVEVSSELDCEEAATEQACEDWEWEPC